jgi:hypothetical protein
MASHPIQPEQLKCRGTPLSYIAYPQCCQQHGFPVWVYSHAQHHAPACCIAAGGQLPTSSSSASTPAPSSLPPPSAQTSAQASALTRMLTHALSSAERAMTCVTRGYLHCCNLRRLCSVAYAAIVCFALEYVGLFLGVSIFMHGHSCLYIMLHFVGAILTGLMYTNVSMMRAWQ